MGVEEHIFGSEHTEMRQALSKLIEKEIAPYVSSIIFNMHVLSYQYMYITLYIIHTTMYTNSHWYTSTTYTAQLLCYGNGIHVSIVQAQPTILRWTCYAQESCIA